MSRRRCTPAGLGLKIAALAVGAALIVVGAVFAVRLLSGAVRLVRSDGGETVRDPQFAEPAETVTRPPEMTGEGEFSEWAGDPSENWDLGEQTPVDKTAEELSREAQAAP